jgi:rubrerythrin
MKKVDEVSSVIFKRIADEEVEHVEAARAALGAYLPQELQERARILSQRI